jgi:integrase
MMRTAVADEMIVRNPCQVERAGIERAVERPVATVAEVDALAAAIAPRFRALILVSAWCGLRRGELLALRRADVDTLHSVVRVERAMHQLVNGSLVFGPPKTDAGRRKVAIPPTSSPTLSLISITSSRLVLTLWSSPARRADRYARTFCRRLG